MGVNDATLLAPKRIVRCVARVILAFFALMFASLWHQAIAQSGIRNAPSDLEALILAARYGDTDLLKALIAAGVNVNAVDEKGWSALAYAAAENQSEAARVLMASGARIDATQLEYSPVIIAAVAGSTRVLQIFLTAGLPPPLFNEALAVAAGKGDAPMVEQIVAIAKLSPYEILTFKQRLANRLKAEFGAGENIDPGVAIAALKTCRDDGIYETEVCISGERAKYLPAKRIASSVMMPLSGAEERAIKPKDLFKECEQCPEMVVMPAGSFIMGAIDSRTDSYKASRPQHQVTFVRPFAVGRFAVTFDEWDSCVAEGGCRGYKPNDGGWAKSKEDPLVGWGRGRRPVINVSWDDANAYVAWLSRKTGKPYRLPSEAEREYVTRAGTTTPYWWGASVSPRQANYAPGYSRGGFFHFDGEFRGRTLPVDAFEPNPWGLYQVHGNVMEWTEDCWHANYVGAPTDGSAWIIDSDCGKRVLRNGPMNGSRETIRADVRGAGPTNSRGYAAGFRVARMLPRAADP
jgi:formylglycine-generating enzyme required for sulfatase activity